MGRQMSNYIINIIIKTLNIGDRILVHYSFRRLTPRCKAQILVLRGDQNVIKLKNKNKN